MFINDLICLSYQLLELNDHADASILSFVTLLYIYCVHFLTNMSLLLFNMEHFASGP